MPHLHQQPRGSAADKCSPAQQPSGRACSGRACSASGIGQRRASSRQTPAPGRACNGRPWGRAEGARGGQLLVCRTARVLDKVVKERQEFRRNVGLCVVNDQGLVFAARRVDDRSGSWQMPQGGIDPLENPMVAARRELQEETGMRSVRLLATLDRWIDYEFPTEVRHHMTGDWLRFRGQTMKWFLAHFHGHASEIDLCQGGHEPEFSEFRWMPLEELPGEVVHFKRDVYTEVDAEFSPRIRAWLHASQKQQQQQQQQRLQ